TRFNADGSAANFGALGSNVIDGEGAEDETAHGHLVFSSERQAEQVAIDESGEATDGNIYVTQSALDVIDIFNAEGEYLGQLSESTAGGAFGEPCGVAVDSEGTIYVGDRGDDMIHVFDPAANPPVNGDITASYATLTNPCGIAAGTGASAGFLFVNRTGFGAQVSKLDAASGELKYQLGGGGSALTVDPGTGHLFIAKNTGSSSVVEELDVSGASEASLVSSFKPGSTVEGVAVNSAEEQVYVSRASTENVEVFGPPAIVPDVVTSPPSSNTGARATLAGTVNPDGVELDECFFEWGVNTSSNEYGETVPCAETPAEIGSGTTPVAVHADLSGLRPHGVDSSPDPETITPGGSDQLNPGGDYEYRLVAVNPNATINGSNQNFSTPKTVFTEAASGIAGEEATLNGTVNPDGETISACAFEWGPAKESGEGFQRYPESAPCVPGPGGITGTSPVAVEAELTGLHPGTSYVYRLMVTYPTGDIFALDESAQTAGPVAESWSENVGLSEATLKAAIDPEGKATTYRFEYGTSEAYGSETAELAVGSDSSVHTVARFLTGLEEDTTYHYRLVATNTDAENVGPDQTFTTYARFVPDRSCANQEFRYGAGANLPDCRGYEMVSPVDKNGGDIIIAGSAIPNWKEARSPTSMAAQMQAAHDGGRITYSSETSFGDQPSNLFANQYIATRGSEGWSTHGINAPKEGNMLGAFLLGPELANDWWGFTEDLSEGYAWNFNDPPLTAAGNPGFPNLYRRDLSGGVGGAYEALTNTPSLGGTPQVPSGSHFEAFNFYMDNDIYDFSTDGSVVFIGARQAYTPDADPTTIRNQLYAFSEGELHLVSVLPDGSASPEESDMGVGQSTGGNWASEDGRRVYFRSGNSSQFIYLRTNPLEEQSAIAGEECTEPEKACTVKISDDHAVVLAVSDDGAKVWYREGTGGANHRLYEYDAETDSSTLISTSPRSRQSESVLGASADLSRVYHISRNVLAPGAVEGEPNLYLREAGEEVFVARLWEKDIDEGRIPNIQNYNSVYDLSSPFATYYHTARVSSDGRFATFMSLRSLTEYDSTDALSGEPDAQVYQYDAQSEELLCVSCNPSGARPEGRQLSDPYARALEDRFTGIWGAGWIPGPERFLGHTRVLMDDGTVFFNSFDGLVARDTNGAMDVYQWKPDGVRGCDRPKGCVELLSTGQSRDHSRFIEADADGSEVFFTTTSSIAPQDPGSIDLYVAREGGGYPPPPSPPDCAGDGCHSVPPAPRIPTPASAGFKGAGNPAPQRNCGATARRAAKLSRRAKRLRRAAKRSSAAKRSKALRRRSVRFSRNAKRLSTSAKRCRRANRRASR
ncbi:MAG TPA: hypothetical protein VFT19_10945, partial [Solirubrobacterales bacterium]|nr:hypothetical protein [Solirubrobacterales bacterium]